MIGDVKHKKGTKAVAFSQKNSKGRSYKINIPSVSDGGGDFQQKPGAKRLDKHNARPGTGARDKQNPKAQRNHKIEAWCQGSKDYK
jgi:hypothetical protein